jgi:hypothetical protein
MRKDIKPLPPVAVLRELFDYEPDTGLLKWRARSSPHATRAVLDAPAGTVKTGGYLAVGLPGGTKGKFGTYYVHRIIWKMMTGDDPVDQIDHADGDRQNNRWQNLRAASNSTNKQNSRLYKNNTSGVKGVCWDAYHAMFVAYITVDSKQRRLGRFKDREDAISTVNAERARLHGAFARFE